MEEDLDCSGWIAIDEALKRLYPDQQPKHYGTIISYELGGPDPLRGISAYKNELPERHWHFVTYGFSELYEKESEDLEYSGYGFELTFRLKVDEFEDEAPMWVMNFLQNLARYVFNSGNTFKNGDYMNANGPISSDEETEIRSIAFTLDSQLPVLQTKNGRVEFLQLVGITNDEEISLKQWATLKVLEIFKSLNPLLITDLSRSSYIKQKDVKTAIEDGAKQEGSNTGYVFIDQLELKQTKSLLGNTNYTLILGARQINELIQIIPYRIPFDREFGLVGQNLKVWLSLSGKNAVESFEGSFKVLLVEKAFREIVETLIGVSGTYKIPSFPNLVIEVKKTYIKNHNGDITETIG